MGMWERRVLGSMAALAMLLLLALVQFFTLTRLPEGRPRYGGVVGSPGAENDVRVIDLARFAVSQHNSNKTNALLEFQKVVKVKTQLVAGVLYYITIQVNESGAMKLYEAKVWTGIRPHPKQLVEFNPAEDQGHSLLRIMYAFLPWLNRAGADCKC